MRNELTILRGIHVLSGAERRTPEGPLQEVPGKEEVLLSNHDGHEYHYYHSSQVMTQIKDFYLEEDKDKHSWDSSSPICNQIYLNSKKKKKMNKFIYKSTNPCLGLGFHPT